MITNPAGMTFADPGDWTDFIDFAGTPDDDSDDVFRSAGSIYRIHLPGSGIVVHDSGLIIFYPDGTVVVHGPHDVYYADSDAPICNALG